MNYIGLKLGAMVRLVRHGFGYGSLGQVAWRDDEGFIWTGVFTPNMYALTQKECSYKIVSFDRSGVLIRPISDSPPSETLGTTGLTTRWPWQLLTHILVEDVEETTEDLNTYLCDLLP